MDDVRDSRHEAPQAAHGFFQKVWQRKGDGEHRKIKALCRVEQPYPESMEKHAESQRFPGMGDSLTG